MAGTVLAGLACTAVALAPVAGAAPSSGRAAAAPAASAHAVPAAAKSAKAPATAYNNACGTGYGVVNSAPIGSAGTVYLTYSATTKKNCVVTVRANPGSAVHMTASLGLGSHTRDVVDEGNYTTYAGPVYLSAPGQCVSWRGEIAGTVAGKNQTNCAALAR
ncbi:spore-associated protein A [Streptomyces sp. NPDC047002]|uniref:spore-associated protein A n=1 Tax=Streptomyces sp. NPDC047002 TaxID=3155475 RepID=UPI003452BD44